MLCVFFSVCVCGLMFSYNFSTFSYLLSSKENGMMLSLMSTNQLTICRRDDFFYGKIYLIFWKIIFREQFSDRKCFSFFYWAQEDIGIKAFKIITIKKAYSFMGTRRAKAQKHINYKPSQTLCLREIVCKIKWWEK